MARHVVLLRGINVGSHNRIAMPALRQALEAAGFEDVRTHLQSGNVLVTSTARPATVAAECERVIAERFGLEIPVVVRLRTQLAAVVARNPLGGVASEPKLYQVSFLAEKAPAGIEDRVAAVAAETERFVVDGREIYAWHPRGVARSKLWALLAGKALGVTATSRNWTTVTKLLELAGEE